MRKFYQILLILCMISLSPTVFSFTELTFDAGYNSNVTEDSNKEASAYFIPKLFLQSVSFISKDQIIFAEASAQVKNYFAVKEENMLIPSGLIKWRFKGEDQVFDLIFKGYLEHLWNDSEYSFYQVSLSPEYRYDFETLSIYLGAETGYIQYPNYEFDRVYLKGYAATSFDLSWKFSLNFKAGLEKEWFKDKYVLDSSFNNTTEKMERTVLSGKAGFFWLISPNASLEGWGIVEKHDSQGNYYFYGPEEDTLIVDGDEELFPDYYTKNTWEAGLEFKYEYEEGSFSLSVSYAQDHYASRYPLDMSGAPVLNDTLYVQYLNINPVWKLFLEKDSSLTFHYGFQKKISNDYYEDTLIHNIGVSLNFLF